MIWSNANTLVPSLLLPQITWVLVCSAGSSSKTTVKDWTGFLALKTSEIDCLKCWQKDDESSLSRFMVLISSPVSGSTLSYDLLKTSFDSRKSDSWKDDTWNEY